MNPRLLLAAFLLLLSPLAAPTAPAAAAPKGDVYLLGIALDQAGSPGGWARVGPAGAWKQTLAGAVLDGRLYTVESSGVLYVTNLDTGAWKDVGKPEFANTRFMFASAGRLYTVETSGSLYRVDPADGTWALVGADGAFAAMTAGAVLHGQLFEVEKDGGLYAADLTTGERRRDRQAAAGVGPLDGGRGEEALRRRFIRRPAPGRSGRRGGRAGRAGRGVGIDQRRRRPRRPALQHRDAAAACAAPTCGPGGGRPSASRSSPTPLHVRLRRPGVHDRDRRQPVPRHRQAEHGRLRLVPAGNREGPPRAGRRRSTATSKSGRSWGHGPPTPRSSSGFAWLREQAKADDLAIVYVDAHGSTDPKQGWGISTADGKTLWGREVKAELAKLPCQALVFVETCTSGGFAQAHARRPAAAGQRDGPVPPARRTRPPTTSSTWPWPRRCTAGPTSTTTASWTWTN